jgi:hypothetical protein
MLKQVSMALSARLEDSATVISALAQHHRSRLPHSHHRYRNDGHHTCQFSSFGWDWY